jgi:hypothetical protein
MKFIFIKHRILFEYGVFFRLLFDGNSELVTSDLIELHRFCELRTCLRKPEKLDVLPIDKNTKLSLNKP